MKSIHIISLLAFVSSLAIAQPQFIRWTQKDDKNPAIEHVLDVVNSKAGLKLTTADVLLIEDRALATSQFQMYSQMALNLPIRGQNIRVWKKADGTTLQVEANVDAGPSQLALLRVASLADQVNGPSVLSIAKAAISKTEDSEIRSLSFVDEWYQDQLVRTFRARGRRGVHVITVSISGRKVIESQYKEFPQMDADAAATTFNVPAKVYPIWEEYEGVPADLNGRVMSELKYLNNEVHIANADPYKALQTQHYLESTYDPIKGLTEEGRKQGFWAMGYVKQLASDIYNKLTVSQNKFSTGLQLNGKYATVSLHPAIVQKQGITFTPGVSPEFHPNWVPSTFKPGEYEMIPESVYLGRPLLSEAEVLNRVVERLADHDPVKYLNAGFDEIQVYWAVTQMFESLSKSGFTDPELSTRPFHAIMYDTDITMRNNAYYTDDTINFTTYSGTEHNMARDNTTIWHELGHGVMDRLMGDHITLADTGGLSEGMADFVAQLTLNDVTGGKTFVGRDKLRIFNHTGFMLTNEVHDDGEAYGGSMNDLLVAAMAKEGLTGLKKVTDLTLESMRLTRNHPGLTANGWFEHMLFADEVGSAVRAPGEMKTLVLNALASRNFNLNGAPIAQYTFKHGADLMTATGPGSRPNPIPVPLLKTETTTHELSVSLQGTTSYQFKYPVTVKVQLKGGPLQGAIHWNEEAAQPLEFKLQKDGDVAAFKLTATGVCDEVNRPDGSCVDYAYVQIWNDGATDKPVAKKRFYLNVKPKS